MAEGMRQYFQNELRTLREEASRFAADHPSIARELGLADGHARDPQMELLMQSFAYLTGRLNFRLDEDRGLLPNLLLGLLYPHLMAPLPSAAVAQIDVKPDGANFAAGWSLRRHRQVSAVATTGKGQETTCRLRTVYDTPLVPLTIESVELASANEFGLLTRDHPVQSVLRVDIKRRGDVAIGNLHLESLRFHIAGDDAPAYALYDLLSEHCSAVAVRAGNGKPIRFLPEGALRWLGFSPEEAALPQGPETHPGFRLLQEYFAFRQKFLFFDVCNPDVSDCDTGLQLLFLLDAPASGRTRVNRDSLRLNCVPLINLYPQRIEPLRLDHRQYEYRLIADATRHRFSEIHTLLELSALQANGEERPIAPYFAATRYDQIQGQDYFYLPRRSLSPFTSVPGTEFHLSFLDLGLDMNLPPGDAIVGRALCTNRRLAEYLGPADLLELEGPGPVERIRLLGKPSAHRAPHLLGSEPWALLAQLAPNHLSLTDRPEALEALKRMLSMHCDAGNKANQREIGALRHVACGPAVKWVARDGVRGVARGTQVRIRLDQDAFATGSTLLFGEVLQRFLGLYAGINSFITLALEGVTPNGVKKQWPPMAGDRIVV